VPGNVVTVGERHSGDDPTIIRANGDTAIWGVSLGDDPEAAGVRGQSLSGVGVQADSGLGYGLRVRSGGIKVDEASGIEIVPAGERRLRVEPGLDVTEDTIILLTPYANLRGGSAWVKKDVASDAFIINLPRAINRDARFGWLMIDKAADPLDPTAASEDGPSAGE
jgi:hypothetical protein